MNKLVLFLMFVLVFNCFSQEKRSVYVDKEDDYVILLEKKTKMSKMEIDGANISLFVNTKNDVFNYTLSISKIYKHNFVEGNLLDDSYEKFYGKNCNCTITDKEIVYYNNIETLRYKIKTKKGDRLFLGYSDSFVSGLILYNVIFLSYEKDFDDNIQRHTNLMNSFIFNGKSTIDRYSK
ncbi:hypothetical protein F7018_17195 [Tenacibaculum aiptasiae]|uniref:Uncharacterized protein n=1 Tax=Tenacibaculum aiptasiae TaxID=426481 RepID=A0A7J5A767_9FLAO|nr:hypothetical protein [Tenacibaculum aiptasiae]KAB1153400.1 hypothetical protein F7018_17195 [Tenacibaculum aiptasiae]